MLVDFTHQLTAAAQRWQPNLVTVRNLFARPVLEPESEAWFAQTLDSFLQAYDYTALMAMPRMENAAEPTRWLRSLARAAKARPDGIRRTVFELQAWDWRTGKAVPASELHAQVRLLQVEGIRHLAWYPDGFLDDQPPLDDARALMSSRTFPYLER